MRILDIVTPQMEVIGKTDQDEKDNIIVLHDAVEVSTMPSTNGGYRITMRSIGKDPNFKGNTVTIHMQGAIIIEVDEGGQIGEQYNRTISVIVQPLKNVVAARKIIQ